MNTPIIFISLNRIKDGKADSFREHYRESQMRTQAEKPDTSVQLAYENEAITEVTVIRLLPDADALDAQIHGVDQRSKKTYEFIEPTAIEIFGKPNAATIERMKLVAGSGIMVSIHPNFIGGFVR